MKPGSLALVTCSRTFVQVNLTLILTTDLTRPVEQCLIARQEISSWVVNICGLGHSLVRGGRFVRIGPFYLFCSN